MIFPLLPLGLDTSYSINAGYRNSSLNNRISFNSPRVAGANCFFTTGAFPVSRLASCTLSGVDNTEFSVFRHNKKWIINLDNKNKTRILGN